MLKRNCKKQGLQEQLPPNNFQLSWWILKILTPENFWSFTSGGQINCFEANLFWMQVQCQFALKQIPWKYYNCTETFNSLKEGIKII